jgi:hypothetical protein
MKFVKERVNSMVKLLGGETLGKILVDMLMEEKPENKKLFKSPQVAGVAISQKDNDALLH